MSITLTDRNPFHTSFAESTKHLLIRFFMKPDQQSLSFPQHGSAQVSRRPQHEFLQCFVVRLVAFDIHVNNLLSSCGINVVHLSRQFQGVFKRVSVFLRVDFAFDFNFGIGKKLLRFGAGVSAGAVIAPIDFRHACFPEFVFQNAINSFSSTEIRRHVIGNDPDDFSVAPSPPGRWRRL